MAVRPIDGEALWDKLEDALWYDNYDRDMAEKIVLDMPTLTPPNEPMMLDKKRVIAESCLHYGKSGRCGLNGYAPLDCPRCKEWQRNEPNEPLTLDELRQMGGEPVWVKVFGPTDIRCDGWCEVEVRDKNTSDEIAYVWWAGSEVEDIGRTEDYGKTWITYRHPPVGEEGT